MHPAVVADDHTAGARRRGGCCPLLAASAAALFFTWRIIEGRQENKLRCECPNLDFGVFNSKFTVRIMNCEVWMRFIASQKAKKRYTLIYIYIYIEIEKLLTVHLLLRLH